MRFYKVHCPDAGLYCSLTLCHSSRAHSCNTCLGTCSSMRTTRSTKMTLFSVPRPTHFRLQRSLATQHSGAVVPAAPLGLTVTRAVVHHGEPRMLPLERSRKAFIGIHARGRHQLRGLQCTGLKGKCQKRLAHHQIQPMATSHRRSKTRRARPQRLQSTTRVPRRPCLPCGLQRARKNVGLTTPVTTSSTQQWRNSISVPCCARVCRPATRSRWLGKSAISSRVPRVKHRAATMVRGVGR
jgi:hypothetical protein